MTTAKKPAACRRKKKKSLPSINPTTHDIWARTQMLVEVLLGVMEREVRARKSEPSERWLKLFGAKDSAVVNLQKLVVLLGELQAQAPSKQMVNETTTAAVDPAELAILSEWLKSTSAGNVSPAGE